MRYSTSPELHLRIGDSRLRRRLLLALLSCQGLALGLVFRAGYHTLAVTLVCLVLALLPGLLRHRSRGLQLHWRAGQWALGREGTPLPIELSPSSRCLPWGVYLIWRARNGGGQGSCWIFSDSLSTEDLRRLRGRLSLQW